MEQKANNFKNAFYIDMHDNSATHSFGDILYGYLKHKTADYDELVILCIGTDKATGDCLGPITGHKLRGITSRYAGANAKVKVFGNLEKPVHAKNIHDTINTIYTTCGRPFIVAIDACLGRLEHVGFLTIGEGAVKPGAGVNKELPVIGNIFITGIVNLYSSFDYAVLQSTRLNTVMKMADIIDKGIVYGLDRLYNGEKGV